VLPFPVELLRYFEAAAHAADSAVPRAGIPDPETAADGAILNSAPGTQAGARAPRRTEE
jgi:hypothetical protein